jgi:cell division protein FtsQ
MVKAVKRILLVIPVLYLAVIPFLLESYHNSQPCSRVVIHIIDSSDHRFVTKSQLMNLVYRDNARILGSAIKSISIGDIEKRINRLKELRIAEAYIVFDGTLHIWADQRNPLMRVIPDRGGDYFIDEDGYTFRRRNLYSPRLHIVGGNINITPAMLENVSVFDTSMKDVLLRNLFLLVKYINNDKFWSAQIDQIYVDNREEIDLFPRVGNHLIHLGSLENYEGKLRNLEAFYDKVLPVAGWNRYSMINLEFKDQIVCRRRE